MIYVDIPEIEKLSELLVIIASLSDETLSKLRHIYGEMQSDLELANYPQCPMCLEATALSIDALNRANDMLQSLKGILLSVPGEYEAKEQEHRNMISRMTELLAAYNIDLGAAISPTGVPIEEQSAEQERQAQVQQLVADSAAEMELTNIAAISKVVKEEYDVRKVEDM